MTRLEPTKQTIKKLFALSGNECAFPKCPVPMVEENGNLLGQICHIEAAQESGERFNLEQTDEERRSFENLLILCPTHHAVTNDVATYDVDAMQQMKKEHEDRFQSENYEIPEKLLIELIEKLNSGQTNTIYGHNAILATTKTGNITVNNYHGLSSKETTVLFQELYEKNKTDLLASAETVARERVGKLGREFFVAADKELSGADLEKFSNPDVQEMMLQAANYASRKDSEVLRKHLSKLLVDRIKHDGNELKSIIYDEAIATVGKLTNNQLNILTLVFLLLYTSNAGISNWDNFNQYVNQFLKPFMEINSTQIDFQHLVYTGCASLSFVGRDLGKALVNNYPFLFAKMIPQKDIDVLGLSNAKNSLFQLTEEDGKCFYVPKTTIRLENLEENLVQAAGIDPEVSKKVVEIYKKNLKGSGEVAKDLKEKTDSGGKLVDIINDKNIRSMSLTSVGIVIAASHYEQVTNSKLDIDIWIKK